jgi:hypothetical protein
MNRYLVRALSVLCFVVVALNGAMAQKGGQTGQQSGQGGQGGGPQSSQGGQGLPGLSFTPSEWPYMNLPNPRNPDVSFAAEGRIVVCYRLAKGNSVTQPYILQPVDPADLVSTGFYLPCGEKAEGPLAGGDLEGERLCKQQAEHETQHWTPCTELRANAPSLRANQILVVGIDISGLGQAGLNTKLELTGPNLNQLKILNINVTNQQGSALNPAPVRASFPTTSNGGGASGGQAGSYGTYVRADTGGVDVNAKWIYIGARAPRSGASPWRANTTYENGQIVSDATGVDFYRFQLSRKARKTKESSGEEPQDPFPPEQAADWIIDGEVVWQETNEPKDLQKSAIPIWTKETPYEVGNVVCVLRGKADKIFAVKHPFYSDRRQDCYTKNQNLNKANYEHLHYYFAVKGGKSGEIPKDPFSVQYLPRVIYLPWPYRLPGDVIPTFNVNLVYSQPAAGTPWQGNTFYPAGSVVTPGNNDGHYYTALTGGFSDAEPNEPTFDPADPARVHDGSLEWIDWGASAPTVPSSPGTGSNQGSGGGQGGGQSGGSTAGKPQIWLPFTHFQLGDTILRPENGHYFTVVKITRGLSGTSPSSPGSKDPFPPLTPPASTLSDGQIVWIKVSNVSNQDPNNWQPNTPYFVDKIVQIVPATYYQMTRSTNQSGKSGSGNSPFGPKPDSNALMTDNEIQWRFMPQATSNEQWQKNHSYSPNQAVCDPRHFHSDKPSNKCDKNATYVMDRAVVGTSGSMNPVNQTIQGIPLTVADGDLLWTALGTQAAFSGQAKLWSAEFPFAIGDVVHADNGQYYVMTRYIGGVSAGEETKFQIGHFCTIIDPVIPVEDQAVEWQDMGPLRPRKSTQDCLEEKPHKSGDRMEFKNWENVRASRVKEGTVIFVPGEEGGRYYKAIKGGKTGSISPFINLTPPMVITWLDSGTTTPASVSSGPPPDQTLSLINLTLPQTHTLSRFNISSGVVANIARPPAFGWVAPTTPGIQLPMNYIAASQIVPTVPSTVAISGAGAVPVAVEPTTQCTYGVSKVPNTVGGTTTMVFPVYQCPQKTGKGSTNIDGVLVLTAYLLPVDAEVPWRFRFYAPSAWRDWVPAPSIGISLTSPTNNFYAGASNEFGVRNLQIFYGVSFRNVANRLALPGSQQVWGGQGTAPAVATISAFQHSFFVGATFNLSNFIQSLFGAAKGQ